MPRTAERQREHPRPCWRRMRGPLTGSPDRESGNSLRHSLTGSRFLLYSQPLYLAGELRDELRIAPLHLRRHCAVILLGREILALARGAR